MPYEKSIHLLPRGSVMVECGPMRLVIDARVGKVPQPQQAVRAADEAVRFLESVARSRPFLGRDYRRLMPHITDPLALKMVASVKAVGDQDLTPMAAVAGTIADAVADFLFERGMTRVLVDNGGDVAIRSCDGEPVTVGIRPQVGTKSISHAIVLGPEGTAWGIATSGLGGRSLTRGVVDAATIVAADASLADPAATAVANASYVEHSAVIQKPAEAPAGEAGDFRVRKNAEGLAFDISINRNPPVLGDNEIRIEIRDAEGHAVLDAEVLVNYYMPPMPRMAPMNYTIPAELKGKEYRATMDLIMTSPWNIIVRARLQGKWLRVGFPIDAR